MSAQSIQRYCPLVTISSTRNSRELAFCFPGAGASVTCFLPFSNSLSIPLNVMGLQARGMDGLNAPDPSVEAAAATYFEAIVKISPQGPYRLLGHSFGGWLAFELAGQLMSSGRRVLPIVMLDTEPPRSGRKFDRPAVIRKYVRAVEKSLGRGLGLDVQSLRSVDADRQLGMLLDAMKFERVIPKSAPSSSVQHSFRVFETQLNTAYQPQNPLPADVYLLHTDDVDTDDEDWITPEEACQRWRRWAPKLHAIRASGNHITMLEIPHINWTIELLEEAWAVDRPIDVESPAPHTCRPHTQ
jgi:thioesterase domain-containing protein